MKNKIILSVSLVLLLSIFTQAQSILVKLSGKIINSNGNKLIINNAGVRKIIKLNEDGTFADTLHIKKAGIYQFSDGRERSAMYLDKGYELNLNIDAKEFDETIKYTGTGAENNNFLAQKYLIDEKTLGNYMQLYAKAEKDFLAMQDSVKTVYFKLLEKLKDKNFIITQKKAIEYDYLIAISQYEPYHQYIIKDNSFKVSPDFLKPLENINYTEEVDYQNNKSYMSLVNTHYLSGIDNPKTMQKSLLLIKAIASKIIKKGVLQDLMQNNFSISNEHLNDLYKAIMENCSDSSYKNMFTKKYDIAKKLLKGNESPKFSYKNIDGVIVSLDDLKGKFVYVDVWATWCSPCRREIPFLKKLEEDFKGKDIAFVSISVDRLKDYDKWKKMVHDKAMKGHQLFADKSWNSDFVQAYQIKGIPTFILIDKEGKIISASAKRPSNPELKKQLEELLK